MGEIQYKYYKKNKKIKLESIIKNSKVIMESNLNIFHIILKKDDFNEK